MNDLTPANVLHGVDIITAPTYNELPEKTSASRAMLTRDLVLWSEESQRIFRRTFKATERNLYAIDVLVSIKLGNEVNQKLLAIVETWMAQIRDDIQSERERVLILYNQLNITETANYSSPVRVRIEWATPIAKRYADMIQKLDDFLGIVNTLWLYDALPPVQNRVYSWQQRFMRLAGRLRALASLVRSQISKSRDLRPHQIELSENLRQAIDQALAENLDQTGIEVDHEDINVSRNAMASAARELVQTPPQTSTSEEDVAKVGKKSKSKSKETVAA